MPALSMFRVLKVAEPATAATVVVPESVPVPGLVPMEIATFAVLVVRLPAASRIRIVTAGEMDVAETALVGWVMTASLAGAPAVMLKALLVVGVRTPEEALRV